MKKKERSKICKSGFNPDRACYLTADGKYYCYEFENLQTGQKITQKFEVGKDLSLKLTIMLDETDHDSDLQKHYEGELRDPLFAAKFNSYKADPKDEDAVDHCDTISAQDSNLEDAIFSTPESENPLATKIYASIESDNIGYADRKDWSYYYKAFQSLCQKHGRFLLNHSKTQGSQHRMLLWKSICDI